MLRFAFQFAGKPHSMLLALGQKDGRASLRKEIQRIGNNQLISCLVFDNTGVHILMPFALGSRILVKRGKRNAKSSAFHLTWRLPNIGQGRTA